MNREQAELLRREIERLILHDDAAQSYVAKWEETMESLFVKNLETVQGDERDVIMISMVYGPNEQGVMRLLVQREGGRTAGPAAAAITCAADF